jgi:hypothetical protein
MGKFLLGFFVAALMFVPDRTVDFVASVGANLDRTLSSMYDIGIDAAEKTRQEILRKEIERKLKLEE